MKGICGLCGKKVDGRTGYMTVEGSLYCLRHSSIEAVDHAKMKKKELA
jgi:hypothetical protein